MSMKSRLTRQIIRSLNEHPEDWFFGEAWARNEHLKLRVYKRKGAPFVDIWFKEDCVVKEWRNLLAYFVPWRCRMMAALRKAEAVADQKRLSLKIEDSFPTPTPEGIGAIHAIVRRHVEQLQARINA